MPAYPFNPQIFPGKSLSHHEHLKITVLLLLILIVAAVASVLYVYQNSKSGTESAFEHKAIDAQRVFISEQSPPAKISPAELSDRKSLISTSKPSSSQQKSYQLQSNRALLKTN